MIDPSPLLLKFYDLVPSIVEFYSEDELFLSCFHYMAGDESRDSQIENGRQLIAFYEQFLSGPYTDYELWELHYFANQGFMLPVEETRGHLQRVLNIIKDMQMQLEAGTLPRPEFVHSPISRS